MPTRPPTYLQRLRAREKKPARKDEAPRPSAAKQGYGRHWRAVRLAYLREHPMCAHPGCDQPARDVDHRLAKAKGGTDDPSNLQGLCRSHHSSKTVREDGALRARVHLNMVPGLSKK